MNEELFVDYYEVLQVSPNAHADTIDRIFRSLAQRYHPDNQQTGDIDQFRQVVEAHEVLRDQQSRAKYDIRYAKAHEQKLKLSFAIFDQDGYDNDRIIQQHLLDVFYAKRRNDSGNPGLGSYYVSQILGCPLEKLEFHLWYLREKGWIIRLEDGSLAITAAGVDRTHKGSHHDDDRMSDERLITNQHH